MATQLNLVGLNIDDVYIKKIKDALSSATGQEIPLINIEKVKRVAGVSAVLAEFVFAGGQALKIYIRAGADVFKAELNGKGIVLSGDFSNDLKMTFDNAVTGVAKQIRDGQKKFELSRTKEKVKIPRQSQNTAVSSKSVSVQLKEVLEQEAVLDQQIVEKTELRDQLLEKIEQAKAAKGAGQSDLGKFDSAFGGSSFVKIHAMTGDDGGKSGKKALSAPHLPSSAQISSLAEAEAYWNSHFKGKTYALQVHSRKAPDKGGHEPISILVYFGDTNHAYSEKPEGASHHNDERVVSLERAKMLDQIIATIQHPHARLISRGNDLLIAAPVKGQQYTVALTWREVKGIYTFESAHFKSEKQISGIRDSQYSERRNKNKGSLQK
ncbi:hypothetical protein LVY74_00620 [Acinetobacter sp. ME22]|uniref:hypothetical protein n=1 Tax=Acinetobacter sp. ME22 TaxID=2904802 RepID=UPI001EDBC59B|nr:hypothetical protein [Acinetobacter sp. ME22]MCG2572062.1 hypothetical protein [Acinetobacter sp. ME22]